MTISAFSVLLLAAEYLTFSAGGLYAIPWRKSTAGGGRVMCRCGHGRACHWRNGTECVPCSRCPEFRASWLTRLVAPWLLRGGQADGLARFSVRPAASRMRLT